MSSSSGSTHDASSIDSAPGTPDELPLLGGAGGGGADCGGADCGGAGCGGAGAAGREGGALWPAFWAASVSAAVLTVTVNVSPGLRLGGTVTLNRTPFQSTYAVRDSPRLSGTLTLGIVL